jgi:hypothetical protein
LKSLEFEKLKSISVDDKKKLDKNKEKLECSLELVKNLLSQKKQLKSKVDEGNIFVFFYLKFGYFLYLGFFYLKSPYQVREHADFKQN